MIEGLSALSLNAVRPYITASLGDAGLFFVFAAVVTACLIYMLFMMPETKAITLEKIENIFLCPRHEGCAIRRDPNALITDTVEAISKMVGTVIKTKFTNDESKVKISKTPLHSVYGTLGHKN